MKTKAVRSQRIAWLLRKEGFKIIDVTPNRRRPNLDVYIFESTPEITKMTKSAAIIIRITIVDTSGARLARLSCHKVINSTE